MCNGKVYGLWMTESAFIRFEEDEEIDIAGNAKRVFKIPIEFSRFDNRLAYADVNCLVGIRVVRACNFKELAFVQFEHLHLFLGSVVVLPNDVHHVFLAHQIDDSVEFSAEEFRWI